MKACPLALPPLMEHDFSTVVEMYYTIPHDPEPLRRTEVRVVCRRCGAVTEPFQPQIVYKLREDVAVESAKS